MRYIKRNRLSKINNMVRTNERGQNTHSKGEWVKIPLLPNKVGKRSGNDKRVTTNGSGENLIFFPIQTILY